MIEIGEYLSNHYASKTAKAYLREIEIYLLNNPSACEYGYSDLLDYVGLLRKRYSNGKSVSRILSSIKVYYNYLCSVGVRSDNPSKSLRLRDVISRDVQLQDLFSSEELSRLLVVKPERYQGLSNRNKVLLSLLIYQGLKPIEIVSLECLDIDMERGIVVVKGSSKSNERSLLLRENQRIYLKKYIESERKDLLGVIENSKLLIGSRGLSLSESEISRHISRHYNIYLPRRVTALSIRQSVISNLLKEEHDLRLVQVFAGHKNPSATERYKQSNVAALQQALSVHHPIK